MDTRPASEYAQSELEDLNIFPSSFAADPSSAAASTPYHPPHSEARPQPHYPQSEVRPANISSSNTPQSEYGLNPTAHALARLPGISPAPAVLRSELPTRGPPRPTYPPPYSPYQPGPGHEMQYQGHPPPPHQMYARPEWPHSYGQHQPGMPHYPSPATTVGSPSPASPAGSRPGQVYSFVPIPGAQQHKRPRRRYEEIERMYKCGWNGCEKAYGTLNHLNAHVTMQSHGQKRTPEEFKEIRKEWKARKKEEETQRKAIEERERAAAQAAQANQVEPPPGPSDPQAGQPSAQVSSQYPPGGMVYQSNGQMGYPPNYPHSPYQSGPVYQQRE
ncbi:hypothetical protein N7470_001650 [Penicillium chermesinum]|nr:hypothetical protein N7470_001650 [Penicillium chermesinum]